MRIGPDCSALEQRIEDRVRAERIPGAALAIVHGEEIMYARGFEV